MSDTEKLITMNDMAKQMGIARVTLAMRKLNSKVDFPDIIKIDAKGYWYRQADFDRWLAGKPKYEFSTQQLTDAFLFNRYDRLTQLQNR